MAANHCVCCNCEIPEGRQICPACEQKGQEEGSLAEQRKEAVTNE